MAQTPVRNVRIDDETWEAIEQARGAGETRTAFILRAVCRLLDGSLELDPRAADRSVRAVAATHPSDAPFERPTLPQPAPSIRNEPIPGLMRGSQVKATPRPAGQHLPTCKCPVCKPAPSPR